MLGVELTQKIITQGGARPKNILIEKLGETATLAYSAGELDCLSGPRGLRDFKGWLYILTRTRLPSAGEQQ